MKTICKSFILSTKKAIDSVVQSLSLHIIHMLFQLKNYVKKEAVPQKERAPLHSSIKPMFSSLFKSID